MKRVLLGLMAFMLWACSGTPGTLPVTSASATTSSSAGAVATSAVPTPVPTPDLRPTGTSPTIAFGIPPAVSVSGSKLLLASFDVTAANNAADSAQNAVRMDSHDMYVKVGGNPIITNVQIFPKTHLYHQEYATPGVKLEEDVKDPFKQGWRFDYTKGVKDDANIVPEGTTSTYVLMVDYEPDPKFKSSSWDRVQVFFGPVTSGSDIVGNHFVWSDLRNGEVMHTRNWVDQQDADPTLIVEVAPE